MEINHYTVDFLIIMLYFCCNPEHSPCLVMFLSFYENVFAVKAVESLVRQMACHDWDVVEAVMRQIVGSPVWKHRLEAAKLLVLMGTHLIVVHKIILKFWILYSEGFDILWFTV